MIYSNAIIIEDNIDYQPGNGVITTGDSAVVALHVLSALTSHVTVYFLGDPDNGVQMTKNSLVAGGVYSFMIKKVVFNDLTDHGKLLGCVSKFVPRT